MSIIVIGKDKCGVCESAKKKLDILKLPYSFVDIEKAREVHEGWRDDDSVTALALFSMNNNVIPTIAIDGRAFSYAEAMRFLKTQKAKEKAVCDSSEIT